ncbi:hypothetical protein GCM10011384_08350 [Psychrobacillus lasiicapitis]|nr:hypothetical protein GCM10011384_08350 [Psychrobacillus lasiicapitis]
MFHGTTICEGGSSHEWIFSDAEKVERNYYNGIWRRATILRVKATNIKKFIVKLIFDT